MVVLRGVSKVYSESGLPHAVLKNVDADIKHGEFVALLGRSGSGKSTLLNLIGGLDLPTSGTLRVNGRDIGALAEKERALYRRAEVGFVFQFFNLIPTLSVTENLLLVLELNGIENQVAQGRIDSALRELNLLERAKQFPDRLSGGEQQRVAIARATIHRPLLVLADEPTGNLDVHSEQDVLRLFRRLPDRHGVTVITATHSTEVAAGADRILVLADGRLEEQSP
ncbi:MAG: ABC transporter ATP-binding protein [Gammaproteobacteria bacterium]|nr:ABC transporter ATP-binding protein [Gammaproteobacteria bacterium]